MPEKEKPKEVMSRDGSKVQEPEGLEAFDDSRITKLITTGGPRAICYQLCTQGGGAVWRQVAVPENGHQGVLLIPVRMRSDRVDIGQGWMGSTWLPAAGPAERKPGVTEVVLNGPTQGLDGRRLEVVLLTNQARPGGTGQRPGGAGARRREHQARTGQAEHTEAAQAPERKDRKK